MSVRILAFFDTRYQMSPGITDVTGTTDPWQSLRDARPPSRQYGHVNWPSSLGFYDLAESAQAATVVGLAANAGINGFVVEIRPVDDRYITGAAPLVPLCQPDVFGLAFHWSNGKDSFWTAPSDPLLRRERLRALVAAIPLQGSVHVGERPILIIDQPQELVEPDQTLTMLREEARKAGHPDLYIIGSQFSDVGLPGQGYDAVVDPSPGEWASCPPNNKPSGLDILEIQAGLRDSVEWTDKFYPYALFAVTRMLHREKRGRILPRVFPAYQDWHRHPEGGATILVTRDGVISVDRYIFGLFIENAMTFAHDIFPRDERLVFIESWNHWLDGSQIEPSILDGDQIYNATRSAIDKGRYMIATRGEQPELHLDQSMRDMISQICDAALAATTAKSA